MKYKYQEIEEYIINGIYSEQFKTGTLLPTERELARQFGVSRITVQRALDHIEEKNLIERIQGSGSYVRFSEFELPVVEMLSFTEKFQHAGKLSTKLVYYVQKECLEYQIDDLAKKLYIKDSDTVHYFRRIRLLNGNPICVQDSYVPASRVPFISFDSLNGSFYDYIKKELNIAIGDGISHVSVKLPRQEIAEMLQITPQEPVVISSHTVCSQKGLPIENTISYHNYRYYYLDYSDKSE